MYGHTLGWNMCGLWIYKNKLSYFLTQIFHGGRGNLYFREGLKIWLVSMAIKLPTYFYMSVVLLNRAFCGYIF